MQVRSILIGIIGFAIFLVFAYYLEVAVSHFAIWLWLELWHTRSQMTDNEALFNVITLAFFSAFILPHFFWAPVYVFKELHYLFKEHIYHATSRQNNIQQAPS